MRNVVDLPFKIKEADNFVTRLKGLMFRKEPISDEGLWIRPCNSIHMFFMKFSIDVVMITKEGEVVKTIESLEPWKFVAPVKSAFSTLELPTGTINKFNIKEGDIIRFGFSRQLC